MFGCSVRVRTFLLSFSIGDKSMLKSLAFSAVHLSKGFWIEAFIFLAILTHKNMIEMQKIHVVKNVEN